MSEDRKTEYHGDGIASRWSKRDGARHYTITYRWTPPTEELAQAIGGTVGKSKKITETVPADNDGRFRIESARRLKATRDKERRAAGWMPPHVEAAIDTARKESEGERRAPLLFETAVEDFMAEESKDYADTGKAARSAFGRLGLFFDGRMLDEVTRVDVREYFKQRATGTGAYKSYTATKRGAEIDGSFFSALYTYLQDNGHEKIDNPYHRPRTKKKDSPLAAYHPKRKKITPDPETMAAIFTASKKAKPGANGASGRDLIRDEHRVFWMLCYFTAARPESEPGRLTHGDVRSLADDWAEVAYTDAKNESSNRTLPIPPEVAKPLRAIMEPEPIDKAAREAWRALPIFRKRGSGNPWDRSSYGKAWDAVVAVVEGIDGMVVRDLRPTAKKNMRKAKIDRAIVKRVLGHKPGVHDEYDDIDARDLRAAATALRLENVAEVVRRQQDGEKLAASLAAYQEAK